MSDTRVYKTPEQLQIGDVVPVWGNDLVVAGVTFLQTDPNSGEPGRFARVTFKDSTVAKYAPGTVIAVVK